MNGFFLIDKPTGIASFDCVRKLRKVCGVRRMGFAGTLDPLATGLMIVAVGEATKLLSYLEKSDKVYETTIHLGAVSDTYDSQGKIEQVASPTTPTLPHISQILEDQFLGERLQMPPAFSAIHVNGQRAYDFARKGEKVELKKRTVHFFELTVNSYVWPFLKVMVHCSVGTYIRSLAFDLGEALGCGGYVEELRRTKVGRWSVRNAIPLDEITALNVVRKLLLPEEFLKDWVQLTLKPEEYALLGNGAFIPNVNGFTPGPILAMYEGKCVGVLEVRDAELKFARKFNTV